MAAHSGDFSFGAIVGDLPAAFPERFMPIRFYNSSVLIVDYYFWTDNADELARWLSENTIKGAETQTGMILEFKNEQEMLMFMLRWQGPHTKRGK